MKLTLTVLSAALAGGSLLLPNSGGAAPPATAAETPNKTAPQPPFAFRWLPDWTVEHVAFTWGNSGKPLGGPARWAVGGTCVRGCYPADYAESGRIYFVDKRRQIWLLDQGQVWLIGGTGDLGHENGPAEYAQFCGGGVYGGAIPGVVANAYTAYISDGGLRKISRGGDGRWSVERLTAQDNVNTPVAGSVQSLSELARVDQLTADPQGNLYFVLAGGLAKAAPDGRVSIVITADKVNSDLAAVYAERWPQAKANRIALGSGEGCNLIYGADGAVYGGGRTWPSAWKVTLDGTFVPLVDFAPKDKLAGRLWGLIDPGCYPPHCCMGWGIDRAGYVFMVNEIPRSLSRCEFDKNRVTVLLADGTFALEGTPWQLPSVMMILPDGSHACDAPGAYASRSAWLHMRKEH